MLHSDTIFIYIYVDDDGDVDDVDVVGPQKSKFCRNSTPVERCILSSVNKHLLPILLLYINYTKTLTKTHTHTILHISLNACGER